MKQLVVEKNNIIRFIISLFVLFLLNETIVQSQTVAVELSIDMKKNNFKLPRKVNSRINNQCIPFLKITYRNCTDTDIYFLKIINNHNHFPFLFGGGLAGVPNKDAVLYYFPYHSCSGKKFFVSIKGLESYEGPWRIVSDTTNLNVWEEDRLNGDLGDFYQAIRKQSDIDADTLSNYLFFREKNLTDSAILKNVHEDFIFLKKGEFFSEQYNLIGFYLIGGNYEFYLPDRTFVDYVLAEDSEKLGSQKFFLPKQINGFKLYSGSFSSNSVNIP